MEKSKKRGERRWLSRCTWMRRLRQDWNEHGWKRDPVYDYEPTGDGVCRIFLSERTTLCECFDLGNKQALRFKDTPNTHSFRRKDWDKYRDSRGERVPIQERRASEVVREYLAPRKRRRVVFKKKVMCRCGYVLGFKLVEVGVRNRLQRTIREISRIPKCPNCDRNQKMSHEFYGIAQ